MENEPKAVQKTLENTAMVGSSLVGATFGCLWLPTSYNLSGKIMRAYFEFKILADTSSKSTQYGDGFTFTMMQADVNNVNTTCGGKGSNIGYGQEGNNIIYGNSTAVEFDTYPDELKNDPVEYNQNNNHNHVAIVKNGDNKHSVGGNPACDGSKEGCVYNNTTGNNYPVTWFEDDVIHTARIELDATAGVNNNAIIKVWIDCTDCNDLTSNYTGSTATVQHTFTFPSGMSSVNFGFTGSTAGVTQYVTLYNFGIGFY